MIDRRTLLGAAAGAPLIWANAFRPVFAAAPKDVVVMAKQIDDIISLDPGESFEFSGNEVCGNMYERLVSPNTVDPDKIDSQIAVHWETSSDGLTTTFKLRQDRLFASGKPVTSADVVFSLSRAVIMDKSPAFIINQFGFTKDNVAQRITAPDPHTVVLQIASPQSPSFLFYCLSANVGGIVERDLVMANAVNNDLGNAWLRQHSAGSGAFSLRGWKASESVALDVNPHYGLDTGVKRMIILHRPDASAQLLALRSGDIDIARDFGPEQLHAVANDKNVHLLKKSKASLVFLAMNQNVPELAHPQVRQAIKWAIDYDAITRDITPNTYVTQQAFLPTGLPAALTDQPFHKDVAKARALMAEAGLAGGFSVTLDHRNNAPFTDIAQALQADLAAIGIKVTLIAAENKQVITKTRARQHQLAMSAWGSDYFDPNSNAETFCVNPDNADNARNRTLAWRSSWQDKELSDRTAANVKQQDPEKRIAEYIAIQRLHQQRSPFAMLLQQVEVAAMRQGVTDFVIGALSDQSVYGKIRKA
jgi:peptide/nickel transport system substrate-binding protein